MDEKRGIQVSPQIVTEAQDETTNVKVNYKRLLRVPWTCENARGNDHGPPPDGGALAWAQVVSGHLIVMNTW